MQTEVQDEFLFADGITKGAPTEKKMQKGVNQVSDSCDSYVLTISVKKTGGISASTWKALQGAYHHSERSRLQVVNKFTYLGSTLSRVVHIDDKVHARIAKASAAFGRLRRSIWDRSSSDLT